METKQENQVEVFENSGKRTSLEKIVRALPVAILATCLIYGVYHIRSLYDVSLFDNNKYSEKVIASENIDGAFHLNNTLRE